MTLPALNPFCPMMTSRDYSRCHFVVSVFFDDDDDDDDDDDVGDGGE